MKYSDKLTELQKLSHRLLEVNCTTTTEYLEYTMRELQEQWDVFEEKYMTHFVCILAICIVFSSCTVYIWVCIHGGHMIFIIDLRPYTN